MTDTPIYDQIQWELRADNTSTGQPVRPARNARRQDSTRRPVSVWALVDEHRKRT